MRPTRIDPWLIWSYYCHYDNWLALPTETRGREHDWCVLSSTGIHQTRYVSATCCTQVGSLLLPLETCHDSSLRLRVWRIAREHARHGTQQQLMRKIDLIHGSCLQTNVRFALMKSDAFCCRIPVKRVSAAFAFSTQAIISPYFATIKSWLMYTWKL